MKAYYRHEMRARIIQLLDRGEVNHANDLAKKTSLLDGSETTIQNGFKMGGFVNVGEVDEEQPTNTVRIEDAPASADDLTPEQYETWLGIDENLLDN